MIYKYKSWEWVSEKDENGNYSLKLADKKTRKKQLDEFKKIRKAELKKEISNLDKLF